MDEFINSPVWLKDINSIESNNISILLDRGIDLNSNKIEMEHLRTLYRNVTNERFSNIVDELALRGFEFITKKSNNVLPDLSYSDEESYIYIKKNNNRYKNIDYKFLGINKFITRFNVKSDQFFNFIPLKGFKYLNRKISIDIIRKEFLKNSFEIINYGSLSRNNNDKKDNTLSTVIHVKEIKTLKESYSIKLLFNGQEFKKFREYCDTRGVTEVSKINEELIISFSEMYGIGKKKVRSVKERLEDINKNEDKSSDSIISHLFRERKYEMFRNFCDSLNINNVIKINNELIDKFKKQRGVGNKKVKDVKERLGEVLVECLNNDDLYLVKSSLKILFSQKKYNEFVNFCQIENILVVENLNQKDIFKFSEQKGTKKAMQVKERLGEILLKYMKSKKLEERKLEQKFEISEDKLELLKELKLSTVLDIFDIEHSLLDSPKINDLIGKRFSNLNIDNINVYKIIELQRKINEYKIPGYILSYLNINDRSKNIFEMRYCEDKTLQEIGDIYGFSRERARQITNEVIKELNKKSLIKLIHQGLELYYFPKQHFQYQGLVDFLGEENLACINFFASKESNMFYIFEPLKLLYLAPDKISDLEIKLKEFINSLPEYFRLYEVLDDILEYLEKMQIKGVDVEDIENLFNHYGYTRYGEYFFKQSITIKLVMEILFSDFIVKPLKMNDEGCNKIRSLTKNIFNYNIDDNSNRSITARIRDVESVILVDKKTFFSIKKVDFDYSIIRDIRYYLNDIKSKVDFINTEDIYEKFKLRLQNNNINNKIFLYSLISFYLEDYFDIGKGNTLDIYLNKRYYEYNREDYLLDEIKKYNGVIDKNLILEKLNWSRIKLEDTISKSNKIMSWGRNQLISSDALKLSKKDKNKLYKLMTKMLEKGYTTSPNIYDKMRFDSDLSEVIIKNNVDSSDKLSALIKNLFSDITGHLVFLTYKKSKYDSIKDVILEKYDTITYKKDIIDFLEDIGYRSCSKSNILNTLLDDNVYLEISRDEILPINEFSIEHDIIEEVKEYVLEEMGCKPYISLSCLVGYRNKLPKLKYKWNPHLIKTILCQDQFREVKQKNSDYRYDKVVIVKKDSDIYNFVDLIYYILKNEYQGNMHKLKVFDFLAQKKIITGHESFYKKKLPYELISSDKIKIKDRGQIELVGE